MDSAMWERLWRQRIVVGVLSVGVCAPALLIGGCFPYHFTMRQGVSGVVVDAVTSAPIPKATVGVVSRVSGSPVAPVSATCDSHGAFRIPPLLRWGIYFMPMDVIGPSKEVFVDADGFVPTKIHLRGGPMGPREIALGEVRLEPASP